ncbi:MAG: DUF6541 family protein [Candidatus Bathyarchaeia archaeon]
MQYQLLIPELLFYLFLLVVDGEPFRVALKHFAAFSNLDLVQICIVDLSIGGLVLYTLAVLPFGLFSPPIILLFSAACLVLSIYLHFNTLKNFSEFKNLRDRIRNNQAMFFTYILILGFFFFLLSLQLSALSGFVFGGIFDESIHALKVQLILQNHGVPLTMQPYLPEGIIYPFGAHVLFAYASQILGFDAPTSVFYITVLFKSMSVFGAYFLGCKLSSNKLYAVGLSFIFAFVSSWPLYVTWGSNAFLVGFPLFLVCLGLLLSVVRNKQRTSIVELAVIGLLFGFDGAIMVSFIQVLVVVGLIFLLYRFVRDRIVFRRQAFAFLIIFLFCLLPLAPLFYRLAIFYNYPGHNIGVPSDFTGYQNTVMSYTMFQALQWAFQYISPYSVTNVAVMAFIAALAVLLWKMKAEDDLRSIASFAATVLLAAVLLSFLAYFLPSSLGFISWGHQAIIIIVSMNIMLISFYVCVVRLSRRVDLKRLSRAFTKKIYANVLLAIILLASLNAPFIYYRLFSDSQGLRGSYNMYAVTGFDDYELMNWMKQNLTSTAVVLVSPYEPGLFIPAISTQKIVYPYTASQFSASYQTLVDLINNDVMNETTYGLMSNLSITHVYVGSNAAYWWFQKLKWNPLLFLGNPNFKLAKNFGNAYLFQFNLSNPNVSFYDNFSKSEWDWDGWNAYSSGNGFQNVTETVTDTGTPALQISAQAAMTPYNQECISGVSREFFVQNDSDVTLSTTFSTVDGVNGNDTLAFIVSNIYQNQTVVIETPNGILQNYKNSQQVDSSGSFNVDITKLWQTSYDSPLPSDFMLQIANFNLDGIRNNAYIYNMSVTSIPLPPS